MNPQAALLKANIDADIQEDEAIYPVFEDFINRLLRQIREVQHSHTPFNY